MYIRTYFCTIKVSTSFKAKLKFAIPKFVFVKENFPSDELPEFSSSFLVYFRVNNTFNASQWQ